MQPSTWFGKLWTRIREGIVEDLPPSLEACEWCRETNCTQQRWLSCARRLAAEAETLESPSSVFPSLTGRTDEMPGLFIAAISSIAMPAQDDESAGESAEDEAQPQTKRISSSSD